MQGVTKQAKICPNERTERELKDEYKLKIRFIEVIDQNTEQEKKSQTVNTEQLYAMEIAV